MTDKGLAGYSFFYIFKRKDRNLTIIGLKKILCILVLLAYIGVLMVGAQENGAISDAPSNDAANTVSAEALSPDPALSFDDVLYKKPLGFLPRLGVAVGTGALSNAFTIGVARIGKAEFAQVTAESIRRNLKPSSWEWEPRDRFYVNQIGHPYQGAIYFNSARAMGFNFYSSFFFAALGSFTWESIFESAIPSTNDLVTTIIGGAFLGEMTHRLYAAFSGKGTVGSWIGSTLLSPADRFANFITGGRGYRTGNGASAIYSAYVDAGIGWEWAEFTGRDGDAPRQIFDSWSFPAVVVDSYVAYGDPFEQDDYVPYHHFELNAGLNLGITKNSPSVIPLWVDGKIVSDGYLISFSRAFGANAQASTGLSMHFDYFTVTNDVQDNSGWSNICLANHALDWTVKYRLRLSAESAFELKAHAGWTAWGISNYIGYAALDDHNFYGTGVNVKLQLALSHRRFGELSARFMGYALWSYPGALSRRARGVTLFNFSEISYAFPLTKELSLGVAQSFVGLTARFDRVPDPREWSTATKFFVRWNF